jgi:putative ABC transport system permease protein
VLVALAVVSAVAFGALFYAATLASSLTKTTREKAYVAVGGDVSAQVLGSTPLPKSFPYPITELEYANGAASLGTSVGTQADVMTVDPLSFSRTLHWSSDWGPDPTDLMTRIIDSRSTSLPVVVTDDVPRATRAVWLQDVRVPIQVVGRVKVFPGMSEGVPLVITSTDALGAITARLRLANPLGITTTYVWAKGPPAPIEQALAQTSIDPNSLVSVDTYLKNSDFLLATRALSYMRILGFAAAALVLIGLMLYLQARQRSQAIASALARRMGLRRDSEIISLWLELAGIAFFAGAVGATIASAGAEFIVQHLDPLPQYPPAPVFQLPVTMICEGAVVLLLVSLVAAVVTSWVASRTDMSEALRVA